MGQEEGLSRNPKTWNFSKINQDKPSLARGQTPQQDGLAALRARWGRAQLGDSKTQVM